MNKRMCILAVALFVASLFLVVGANIWYTNTQLRHECQALSYLTAKPVSYPADPGKNPSRVQLYNLYEALLYWQRSEGC
jgi:hypothetical protein